MGTSSANRADISVLMATTSFPADATTWQGRFIYDLAESLNNTKQINLALWGPLGDLPGRVISANLQDDSIWLRKMVANGGIAHLLRTRPIAGMNYARGILSRLRRACLHSRADIYHFNWMQLALALPNDAKPLYLAVLGSDFGMLKLPGMKSALRRVFTKHHTIIAPNSEWMINTLTERFGDIAEIESNPFGVSPDWFDIKREPKRSHEWLVVTRVTRKKIGDLLTWGKDHFNTRRRLRLLGPMQEDIKLPPWIIYGGPTNPKQLKEHWFPEATGLLTLSHHDEGRPQILIEAMAAGWLIDNPTDLSRFLCVSENLEGDIGKQAKLWIRDHIGTWDDYAKRCLKAHTKLLNN